MSLFLQSFMLFGPKVIRVAAIEIRAVDSLQYRTLVDAYTKYSAPTKPVPIQNGYSFESGDKEVRVVMPNLDKKNLAIVYWKVKGKDESDIKETYEKWLRHDYQKVAEPARDGSLTDSKGQPTYSALIKDSDAHQFGIVINPPYPRIDEGSPLFPPFFLSAPFSWVLTTLLTLGGAYLGLRRGMRLGIKKGLAMRDPKPAS